MSNQDEMRSVILKMITTPGNDMVAVADEIAREALDAVHRTAQAGYDKGYAKGYTDGYHDGVREP